ncbi:hypothetical protein [Actinomadura luteofluorescens]|uniref:hypothetical protein n=1 Tax=Actinomadura luteofluorescens TaxID=46163 RepID=UPI0035E41ACF
MLAVGEDAGVADLRPHRLRHTYGTRLRRDGADPAQMQYLLGTPTSKPPAATSAPGSARSPSSSSAPSHHLSANQLRGPHPRLGARPEQAEASDPCERLDRTCRPADPPVWWRAGPRCRGGAGAGH